MNKTDKLFNTAQNLHNAERLVSADALHELITTLPSETSAPAVNATLLTPSSYSKVLWACTALLVLGLGLYGVRQAYTSENHSSQTPLSRSQKETQALSAEVKMNNTTVIPTLREEKHSNAHRETKGDSLSLASSADSSNIVICQKPELRLLSKEQALACNNEELNKILKKHPNALVSVNVNTHPDSLPIPTKINGIEVLELSSSELEALGVVISDKKIQVPMEDLLDKEVLLSDGVGKYMYTIYQHQYEELQKNDYDTSSRFILRRYISTMEFNHSEVSFKIVPYTGWKSNEINKYAALGLSECFDKYNPANDGRNKWYTYISVNCLSALSPLLQNSHLNWSSIDTRSLSSSRTKDMSYRIDWMQSMLSEVSIPVQLEMDNFDEVQKAASATQTPLDSTQLIRATFRIYYAMTPEFIAALPNRYRLPLVKEFGLYTQVIKGEMPAEQACKEISQQKSYLDICRASSGHVQQLRVMPNPAHDHIRCQFQLVEKSNLSICLYTSAGDLVQQLQTSRNYSVGEQQVDVPLKDVARGMYLVVLISDTGEQVVQRLMVE